MTRQVRNVIITVCIVAVLAVSLIIIKFMPGTKGGSKSSSSGAGISLMKVDTKNIKSIHISNSTGEYNITPTNDSKWVVDALKSTATNSTTVSTAVKDMASVSASKVVEENASNLDQYGLGSPKATITVTTSDNKTYTFKVGNTSPTSTGVYLCKQGESKVYIADANLLTDGQQSALYYADTTLSSFDSSKLSSLTKLSFGGSGRTIPFEIGKEIVTSNASSSSSSSSSETTAFAMTKPTDYAIDDDKLSTVTTALESLSATSVVNVQPTDADLAGYGLKNPAYSLTYTFENKDTTLLFGKTEMEDTTEYVYMMIQGKSTIYKIATSSITFYNWNLPDMVASNVYSASVNNMKSLTVQYGSNTWKFDVSGSGDNTKVTTGGKSIDTANFKSFLALVMDTYEQGTASAPSGTSDILKLTIEYPGTTKSPDVIEYVPIDDRRVAVKLNGTSYFYELRTAIDNIIQNAQNLYNGKTVSSSQ